jgi:hypothetical protein
MNFRELCQALVKELGISGGTGPSSTLNQTGEFANVVRWIADSSLWIDNLWRDWKYLWTEYDSTFTGQSLLIDNCRELDRTSVYLNFGEATARNLTWVEWRVMRETRARPSLVGTPVYFSVSPAGYLFLDRPVSAQPLHFEYWKKPAKLVADADIPAMPESYHRLILCRAAIMYGNREAAGEIISGMEAEYIDLLDKLQSDQLEAFRNERMAGQDVPLALEHP